MATADVINMNDQDQNQAPNMVEHGLKPKGHAIAGIDYGLDLLENEDDKAGQSQDKTQDSPGSVSEGPRRGQESSYSHSPSPNLDQSQSQGQVQGQARYQQYSPVPQSMYNGGGYESPVQMPGFASPMDAQSMGGSSAAAGAGFVDSGLMGQLPRGNESMGMGMNMAPPVEEISYEEKRRRKTDALATLARLESQGYVPADKKGSHTTPLAELEAMAEKLTAQRDLDNGIKYQRKILMGFATLAESICDNDDYNIFELDLEGWSESLYENISDYDEVFEELYIKYKDVAKIPPELKLITMIAGSAWMYHMSRNMFGKAASKVPGFDEVMKFDPDLKKHYQQSASTLAQKRGVPVPDRKKDKSGFNFLGQMFGVDQMPDMSTPPEMPRNKPSRPTRPGRSGPPQVQDQGPPMQRGPSQNRQKERKTRNRVPMEEPQDVDGLLSGLVTQGNGQGPLPDEDEIDLSEMENMSDLDMF